MIYKLENIGFDILIQRVILTPIIYSKPIKK